MESIFSNCLINSLLIFLLIIILIVFYNQKQQSYDQNNDSTQKEDINQLLHICNNKLVWILIPFIIYTCCIYYKN